LSGLAGVFFRDGRCTVPGDLSESVIAVSGRGQGPHTIYLDGSCGLAVAPLATTPEEVAAPQPAIDSVTGVVAIMDGWLGEREPLLGVLRNAGLALTTEQSDAHLVLAAYLRLGAGFVSRLSGDFALAVWDPRQQCLVCARDVLGMRPMYYAITRDYFVFGSNPRAVLLHQAVPRSLNQGMLGEYLAFAIRNRQDTLYTAVQRLPPGHLMRVDRGNVSVTSYWDFEPSYRIRYRDPREYEQHFQTLLSCAVSDRLRGVGPIGVTLSGGMDSSAVAGVAKQLLDEDGAGGRLRAYSITYPGEACDETRFIDAVVDRWHLISRRFPWGGFDCSPWEQQAVDYLDIPEYPSMTGASALFLGARADGVRVLLTGEGGDIWQQGSYLPHRQMLEALDMTALFRELRYRAGKTGWPDALRLLSGSLLWGLAPGALRRRIEARRSRPFLPPFLSSQFLREIGLQDRFHGGDCAERYPYASQWQTVKSGRRGVMVHFHEMLERTTADHGLELRHPLLDRRLLEFAVAVPDQLKRCGKVDRHLMRQAMSSVYPGLVRERRYKASFEIVYIRALLMPQVQEVLASPALLDRPWIQPDNYRKFLAETLSECRAGAIAQPRSPFYLWTLFAVEVWYRQVFGG